MQSFRPNISEDWLAVGCAAVLLAASFFAGAGAEVFFCASAAGATASVQAVSAMNSWWVLVT